MAPNTIAAPMFAGDGRRGAGLTNPMESYSEATMMTQQTAAPIVVGDDRSETGLPSPMNFSIDGGPDHFN